MSDATDFANNKITMLTRITPADQNVFDSGKPKINLPGAFSQASKNDNAPLPGAFAQANNNDNKIDGQKLLGDVGGVSQALNDRQQKFPVNNPAANGAVGYASGQALKLGGELVGALFGGGKDDDQTPKADNDDAGPVQKFAQATPQMKAGPTAFGL